VILVVGATGQLGSLVVRQLRQEGRQVRALVRAGAPVADLAATGAHLVLGDLRTPSSLDPALDGVEAVVATANVVAPTRPGDTHLAVEHRGYDELVTRAERAGVRRFVFSSVPVTPLDDRVPQLAAKRAVERRLAGSSMSTLAPRLAPFTEVWTALVGSSIPLRGEVRPMLGRPYAFLRTFRRLSGTTVEDRGLLVVPGPGTNRNAFLSITDCAQLLVRAVDAEQVTGTPDVGGPQVLSWQDVAAVYAEVLHRPVRVVHLPPAAFGVAQTVLAPFAPSASNVMGLNVLMGTTQTDWDTRTTTDRLGVRDLRTVREVLLEKAALPAWAPTPGGGRRRTASR
jgi:uncharacterized protein YbjT (DUF2867 family)